MDRPLPDSNLFGHRSVIGAVTPVKTQCAKSLWELKSQTKKVIAMLLKMLTVVIPLIVSTFAFADAPVPADHSTVQILFVVPYETPDVGGWGGGGANTKAVPRAVVGDLVLPIDSIHPISISIDGEFVGHSMYGTHGTIPVFVLPRGQHKFEFNCDIFKTAKAELKVIGTGSKQYLIVKLLPKPTSTDNSEPTGESKNSTAPPKG